MNEASFEKAKEISEKIATIKDRLKSVDALLNRCCSVRCEVAGTLNNSHIQKAVFIGLDNEEMTELLIRESDRLNTKLADLQKQFSEL